MYTIHVSYLGSSSGFDFFLFLVLLCTTAWRNWVSFYLISITVQRIYYWAGRCLVLWCLELFFFFFGLFLESFLQIYALS